MSTPNIQGDPKNYKGISIVLFLGLFICAGSILLMNMTPIKSWLEGQFGQRKSFVLQLYFWASLGATVASYKFFAEDKDINEQESVKQTPDPAKLRWPNSYDIILYVQRILFSGVQGIIGSVILFAGLGYLGL